MTETCPIIQRSVDLAAADVDHILFTRSLSIRRSLSYVWLVVVVSSWNVCLYVVPALQMSTL